MVGKPAQPAEALHRQKPLRWALIPHLGKASPPPSQDSAEAKPWTPYPLFSPSKPQSSQLHPFHRVGKLRRTSPKP